MPASLEGRVALVTGGGSGVGGSIARALADARMDVWVTGRTAARIEAVATEIGGHALAGDVSREDNVTRWFEQAGPVDLLANNAGVQGPKVTFEQEEPDSWWQVFEINVRGVFLCCRAVIPGSSPAAGGGSSTSAAAPRTCRRAVFRAQPTDRARPRCTASQRCSPPNSAGAACSSSRSVLGWCARR